MIAALFRAEFRRALPLWPWLLACHAITLYLRLRPDDAAFRWLGGIAEWGVWLLSGLLLVASLWADSPSRRDHFLATRPMRGTALFCGKSSALFLLVGLPFVGADLAASIASKQPTAVVLLGMLQTALFTVVALLAAFGVTWAWATWTTAAAGLLIAFAGATTVILAVAEFQSRFAVQATGFLFFAHRQLVLWAALAITGFGLLLIFGKRRPWRRVPLFAAVCWAAVFGLLKWPEGSPAVDARVEPALVHLDINLQPVGKRLEDSLQLQLPSPRTGPDLERSWSFSRVVANGRAVPPWQFQRLPGLSGSVEGKPVQAELRRHFGDGLRFGKSWHTDPYPAIAVLPGVHDPARSFDLDLTVLEVVTRWELVADLPLEHGAIATRGDTRWVIESITPASDFENDEGRLIRVREISPALWLGRSPAVDPRIDLFCVVDFAGGQVRGAGVFGMGMKSAGRWSVRDETRLLRLSSREQYGDGDGPPLDFSRELRLAVLRPVVVRRISYEWKSPRPVPSPAMSEKGGWVPPEESDAHPGTAMEWLAANPAPAAEWKAVAAWLDELCPRLGKGAISDHDREIVIVAVTAAVKYHLEQTLAYREGLSPYGAVALRVLQEALVRNLRPGAIAGPLASDAGLINELAAKGRLPEVTPFVADLARSGKAWRVQSALFINPQAVGLTGAEWLDFYRLYPSAHAYLLLRDTVLPRAVIDAETDRIVEGFAESDTAESRSNLSDLAVVRGHPTVPAWLHRLLSHERSQPGGIRGMDPNWMRYIGHPPEVKSGADFLEWFLAQNPARFVFDPAAGKFQLR